MLVSGSWDTTLRVYSLATFKHTKTIEGQTSEITAVSALSYSNNEPIIASASSDGTVHIYFDFLSSAANKDVVQIAFDFDMRSAKPAHALDQCWPRVTNLVTAIGPKSFFIQHYHLFFRAIELDQANFLKKFLPLSEASLLKTNQSADGSLLYVAMQYRDVIAVREIVKCWISFLTTIPDDASGLIYQDNAQIPKSDLLLLAYLYPEEFEYLISSLVLIPVPNNELRPGTKYLKGEKMYLGEVESPATQAQTRTETSRSLAGKLKSSVVSPELFPAFQDVDGGDNSEVYAKAIRGVKKMHSEVEKISGGGVQCEELESKQTKVYTYYFLPLPGLVDVHMLRAYTMTARELDSFKIFDSIAGKMCQRFVWRVHGRVLHVKLFAQYICYVFFSSLSIYIFPFCIERENYLPLIWVLLGGQIVYDVYYIYTERRQFADHPVEYLKDIWNRMDIAIIGFGLSGNVIRLVTNGDTVASRVCLSVFSICLW